MIDGAMRAVLTTMRGARRQADSDLLRQVEALAQTLSDARAEIAALGADDITASHIPAATDELDAIIAHTDVATHIILECCERLDAIRPALTAEPCRVIQDVTTRIYEACGFQDITGQRITKVVAALQSIERRVADILAVFGEGAGQSGQAAGTPLGAALLHGPQLPGAAMDQSTIDALLASLE